MKNTKNGFSLTELLVSLLILAVAMVFISVFITGLRDEKGEVAINIPVMLNRANVSKALNNDAIAYGLTDVSISGNGKIATIYYYDSTNPYRTLEISTDGKTLLYKDESGILFAYTINAGTSTFSGIERYSGNETYNTNGKSLIGYNIVYSNGEKVEVYAYGRINTKRAYFMTGKEVNAKMKRLAGINNATYDSSDTSYIQSIERSSTEPTSNNKQSDNLVSITSTNYLPIYMWYSNHTLYWWSEDPNPILNQDSSLMLYKLGVLSNISSLSSWDTSNVESMESIFSGSHEITNISALGGWDVLNVTNMSGMFSGDSTNQMKISSIYPIRNWIVSSVEDMSHMFSDVSGLSSLTGLESWNVSSVEDMSYMFSCSSSATYKPTYTTLSPLLNWNTSSVTTMESIFANNENITKLEGLGGWNLSNVLNFDYSFSGITSLSNVSDINGWVFNTSASFDHMFNSTPIHPTFISHLNNGSWDDSTGTFSLN